MRLILTTEMEVMEITEIFHEAIYRYIENELWLKRITQ